jgi:AcrR family transcriptional regulator
MGRHSDNARERILDAAEELVIAHGARHLTFDGLAAQSGVSRGGLLYHFPDKEALLKAMLERLVERTRENKKRRSAQLPAGVGRQLIAHVQTTTGVKDERLKKIGASAFFALAAHNPALLSPFFKDEYRKLMDDLTSDGQRLERAAVISLACDGLRSLELLSACPFNEEERRRIIEEMIFLATEKQKKR